MLHIIVSGSPLHALTPVIIDDKTESVSLGRYMEILEDPTGKLTIDDVTKPEIQSRWFQSEWDVPNFGFTRSNFWVHLIFQKNSSGMDNSGNYLLELAWPLIDRIEFYTADGDKVVSMLKSGDYIPFENRIIKHRNFLFPVKIKSGIQDVYIKLRADDTIQIPLYLWKSENYLQNDKKITYIFGGFFGSLIVMIIYNFFIYISIRDESYLFYIFYIVSQFFYNLLYTGIGFELFWDGYPGFINIIFPISISLVTISAILFVKNFLNLKVAKPEFNLVFSIIIIFSFFNLLPPFFNYILESIAFQNFLIILGSFLIITVSITLLSVYRPTQVFLLSWLVLLSGAVVVILKNYGFIPSNFITNNYVYLSTVLETVLLSFALADRINIMKQEKEEAQAESLRIQKEATETLELKVTERTSELAAANEKLRELDRAKTDFFANISHELRTPLTIMLAPVEEALSGKSLSGDDLEMMRRSGLNLLSLINDLLDVTRITAGRMKLSVSETDLPELVKEFCGGMESAAKLKGISLTCNTSEEPVKAYVDPERMQHVISNFFSNSFKFTGPGGEIEVSVRSEDNHAVIAFRDTGCGIPADKISTIFDRFIQADTSSTRRYEGTGIGLSIVKELVKLHGGEVSVESRDISSHPEDHGTTFTVRIPLGMEHLEGRSDVACGGMDKDYKVIRHVRGIEGPVIQPYKELRGDASSVLVVEDNADLRSVLVNMLSGRYIVCEASDGNEAVKILENTDEIDLVLSDIMMPGMDGYELLRWIRGEERLEDLPVLFLTARADGLMKIEGLDLGATDYVTKPFNRDELLLRIRNQMELKKLRNSAIRNYKSLLEKMKSVNCGPLREESALKIEAVCEFIKEHYTQELEREDLADAAGMNPDTFSRLFNQHTGKTLNEYIYGLRIEESKRRLAVAADDTVTRISLDVGFDSIRTFNRAFKRITGVTPGEYRRGQSANY